MGEVEKGFPYCFMLCSHFPYNFQSFPWNIRIPLLGQIQEWFQEWFQGFDPFSHSLEKENKQVAK